MRQSNKCGNVRNDQLSLGIRPLSQHPLAPSKHQPHLLIPSAQTINQEKSKNLEMRSNFQQIVSYCLVLYNDNTCLIFQHKDITKIESALNKNFSVLCDWFVDNKFSSSSSKNKCWKTSTSLNAFKHNIKEHYFNELKKRVLIIVYVFLIFQSIFI